MVCLELTTTVGIRRISFDSVESAKREIECFDNDDSFIRAKIFDLLIIDGTITSSTLLYDSFEV